MQWFLSQNPRRGKCWSCYSPRQKRGPVSSKNVSTSTKICHNSRSPPKYYSYSPPSARCVPPPPGQQRRPHVVKLSPQPHVPLAWGFSKMNSALQQRRAESVGFKPKIACQLECLLHACMQKDCTAARMPWVALESASPPYSSCTFWSGPTYCAQPKHSRVTLIP